MTVCASYFKRIPGAILVCFGATAAVSILHLPAETMARVSAESQAVFRIFPFPNCSRGFWCSFCRRR